MNLGETRRHTLATQAPAFSAPPSQNSLGSSLLVPTSSISHTFIISLTAISLTLSSGLQRLAAQLAYGLLL